MINVRIIFILFFGVLLFLFSLGTADAAVLRLNLYLTDNGEIVWNKRAAESIQHFEGLNFVESDKEEAYTGFIASFRGETLKSFGVGVKPRVCYDGATPEGKMTGGCKELKEGPISVTIPYLPNASIFKIRDSGGNTLFVTDISSFASCNENMVCEASVKEDVATCPEDCAPAPSLVSPQTEESYSRSYFILLIGGGILMLSAAGGFIMIIVKKKKESPLPPSN